MVFGLSKESQTKGPGALLYLPDVILTLEFGSITDSCPLRPREVEEVGVFVKAYIGAFLIRKVNIIKSPKM